MEVLKGENACKAEILMHLNGEESDEISDILASEITLNDEQSSSDYSSSNCVSSEVSQEIGTVYLKKQESSPSECEMMKERFSKLLLGEDMSGCGNGVCTALALQILSPISVPLKPEKKLMWKREMEWLLSVSDHIVELTPSWQTFPDGTKLEVMTCRPRSDLYINLPALRKLDNMLLEILDSFENAEFWYVDQGIVTTDIEDSSSFHKPLPRQDEKWWLPVPRVPPGGLMEKGRKALQHRRDCTNQILKAAMAINSATLAEMAVPESYLDALPKSGKTTLGELIRRYVNYDQFYPECLLDCLDLSSDHQALDIANRVEATIYVWRRRNNTKTLQKSSWDIVKDLVSDADKREQLADRAESLLLCLKQKFPGLPQTTLDTTKIQFNKDVGRSLLESYSRVLESLAFNIVARIDDLLYVDDLSRHSDQLMPFSKVGMITRKGSGISYPTPYKTAFSSPRMSWGNLMSPARGDASPYIESSKHSLHGFGFKRIFTDGKGKELRRNSDSFSSTTREVSASPSLESSSGSKGVSGPRTEESVEDE
ncbi:hypothetical protein ACS0TY_016244 [Phlomoides rotata]